MRDYALSSSFFALSYLLITFTLLQNLRNLIQTQVPTLPSTLSAVNPSKSKFSNEFQDYYITKKMRSVVLGGRSGYLLSRVLRFKPANYSGYRHFLLEVSVIYAGFTLMSNNAKRGLTRLPLINS